ncbi:MAG TPA: hypothetical protein O0X73_03870 [Methanocorpusculum sp.]|nr:hypothetical protein [Methanocorpusculum sp.]
MDEKDRMLFKGKFTLCVLLLNIIIISIAIAVCSLVIIDDKYWFKMPVFFAAVCACVIAVLFFVPKYKATKTWLNVHGSTRKERLAHAKEEEEYYHAKILAELDSELCDEKE